MLTASADFETAVMAVNQAEIFRFIRKPWDMDFRAAVAEALARHAALVADGLARYAGLAADRLAKHPESVVTESAQQCALRELEAEEPGITHVRWGPDGSVLLQ
jgi:DNA-binding NtrC family response regulator